MGSLLLLPAELVYLNIALLEAMANGCVPITANIDLDTKRIFGDYNHIFTCNNTPNSFLLPLLIS